MSHPHHLRLAIFMHCHCQVVSQLMDILWGLQGMGAAAAAAIPSAVRCIAFPIPDKHDPHQTPSQLGILAQPFSPSRAEPIIFATFAPRVPVIGTFGNIIEGVLTQLKQVCMIFS